MKKEKKVLIQSVINQLAERDPDWDLARMWPKFKVLYNCWRQKELRHKKHTGYFYTESWKRGWLPQADFIRWRDYACSLEKPKKLVF